MLQQGEVKRTQQLHMSKLCSTYLDSLYSQQLEEWYIILLMLRLYIPMLAKLKWIL
jgi:hypothetical protein